MLRPGMAAMARWRLPDAYVQTYAKSDVEAAQRFAAHERARCRQDLAHQIAIAIGWYAS